MELSNHYSLILSPILISNLLPITTINLRQLPSMVVQFLAKVRHILVKFTQSSTIIWKINKYEQISNFSPTLCAKSHMVYRRTALPTSPLVQNNAKILYTLSAASSPNRRISLIKTANTDELLTLVEIALNELNSRIPVRAQQKGRLRSQTTSIWHLSRTCNSNSVRKIY